MTRIRSYLGARTGDVLIVALFVAAEIEVWARFDELQWTGALSTPFLTLPLLLRRRSGLLAALTAVGAGAVASFVHYTESTFGFLAFVVALLVLGLHEPRSRAIAGGIACFAAGVALFSNDPTGFTASDVILMAMFSFAPLAAGVAVRERTERAAELEEQALRLEHARDEAERIAVAEERARIAAELQGLIARAIDVMTVQADAACALVDEQPDRARAPIEAVEEAGREALAETRRLLGVLRRDLGEREPEPVT